MKRSCQQGFTLIELLVVVAIIGILAAIAIPQFQSYRERAFDATARADLNNIIKSQEIAYSNDDEYLDCTDAECDDGLPAFTRSEGVSVDCFASAGEGRFTCTTRHASGGKYFSFSSDTGLFTEEEGEGGGQGTI